MTDNSFELEKLSTKESWRMFRIMAEIVDGFEELAGIPPSISIFGSARTEADHPHYQLAFDTAKILAEKGYGIISGGGGGIMEAANRGAKAGNGLSIGLHIDLPHEENANDYIDINLRFRYFFIRKLMFIKYSQAYIVMPGGMGTVDELSEAFVLMQTEKIKPFPLIFMNREYWKGFFEWLEKSMLEEKYIDTIELGLVHFAETPEEVIEIIKKFELRQEFAS